MASIQAIVIGVDAYVEQPLDAAVNDALQFRRWLLAGGCGASKEQLKLRLLLSPHPGREPAGLEYLPATCRNLRDVIAEVCANGGPGGERLYFYFAGHGLSVPELDEPVLVPADVDATNPAEAPDLVAFSEVIAAFASIAPEQQFFFIDACRDFALGPQIPMIDEAGRAWKLRRPDTDTHNARQCILYAVARGFQTYEGATPGRGAFTAALIEALKPSVRALTWSDKSRAWELRLTELQVYIRAQFLAALAARADKAPEINTANIDGPWPDTNGEPDPVICSFSTIKEPTVILDVHPRSARLGCHIWVFAAGGPMKSAFVRRIEAAAEDVTRILLPPGAYNIAARTGDILVVKECAVGSEKVRLEITLEESNKATAERIKEVFGDLDPELARAQPARLVGVPAAHMALLRGPGLALAADDPLFKRLFGQGAEVKLAALLGAATLAALHPWHNDLARLRSFGVAPFADAPPEGSAVLALISGDAPRAELPAADFVRRGRLVELSLQGDVLREHGFAALDGFPAAGQCAWNCPPGSVAAELRLPDQPALHFALACLPGRVSVLVVVADARRQLTVRQYSFALPGLVSPAPDGAELAITSLRRVEDALAAFARGETLPEDVTGKDALDRALTDPLLGCLIGYDLVAQARQAAAAGAADPALEARAATIAERMRASFDSLADSHILAGLCAPAEGYAEYFARAVARGLPVFTAGYLELSGWYSNSNRPLPGSLGLPSQSLQQGYIWTTWIAPRPHYPAPLIEVGARLAASIDPGASDGGAPPADAALSDRLPSPGAGMLGGMLGGLVAGVILYWTYRVAGTTQVRSLFVLAFAILAGGGLGGLSMLAINLYQAWARRRRGRRPQRKQITPIFDELIGGVIGGVAAGLVIGFLGGLAFNPRVFVGGAAEPFSPWINPIAWALAFPTGAILVPFGTLFSWFEGSRRALLRAVWVALLIAVPITLFVGLIAVILAGLLGLFFGNLLSYRNPPLVIATGAALLGAMAGSVEGFHIGSILCAYRNRASLFAYRQRP